MLWAVCFMVAMIPDSSAIATPTDVMCGLVLLLSFVLIWYRPQAHEEVMSHEP